MPGYQIPASKVPMDVPRTPVRVLLILLVAVTAGAMTWAYASAGWEGVDPEGSFSAVMILVLTMPLFAILSGWIAIGFWTAMLGIPAAFRFYSASRRTAATTSPAEMTERASGSTSANRNSATPNSVGLSSAGLSNAGFVSEGSPPPRTALIMPIYNEDPVSVMASVQATAESVARQGWSESFDVYILSDSTDAEVWLAEEVLWSRVRESLAGHGPAIYYRHRSLNQARKAGNIAEFLGRWGRRYRYFVILDADSTMEGATLEEMVRRMELEPQLGILQAAPVPEGCGSLWARCQQWASRLYGPLFNAGLACWTGGDGNYWGHNAIIRSEPFVQHCGLSPLPGPEPFGGEVLSHDFVEAALMRRAGYLVRLDPDLVGSYEQCPTTIEDHARRDQRWCQGNLQHLKLITGPRYHPVSRWHLLSGSLSYLSSPLFLLFVFFTGLSLWLGGGVGGSATTVALFIVAMAMLLAPKFLAAGLAVGRGRAEEYGGAARVFSGVILESFVAAFAAPLMMIYHSQFVLANLTGRRVQWGAQRRDDGGIEWGTAAREHWRHTLAGVVLTALLLRWAPGLLPWASPLLAGLLLAIPLAKAAASPTVGDRLRQWGWLMTREEISQPRLLRRRDVLQRHFGELAAQSRSKGNSLFAQTIIDPPTHGLHLSLLEAGGRALPTRRKDLRRARMQLRRGGAEAIAPGLRRSLLLDPLALRSLHHAHWFEATSSGALDR